MEGGNAFGKHIRKLIVEAGKTGFHCQAYIFRRAMSALGSSTAAPLGRSRGGSTPETCRAHSGITAREPAPQCSGYEPVPDGHQKLISRVSAIVKTNADN